MQRTLTFRQRSEEEEVKEAGLVLDFDEIARKGSMSREETSIAKWYGIYVSRQVGHHMARVVIAGGQITSGQARVLATCAERYAQGNLCVTTRQSLQFHGLKLPILAALLRDLAAGGLSTFHGCGDVTRNVAACPLADTCRYRRLNVRPYAREIAASLADCRDLDNLPRKFKITLSGCDAGCGQPVINCLGIIAVRRRGVGGDENGFRVLIGGGMGWKAFAAREVFSFVPPHKVVRLARAVGLLFRDHGDRFDRARSRLKFVVHRLGIPACRDLLLDYLRGEGVETGDFDWGPLDEVGPAFPARPLTEDDPVDADGGVTVRGLIPKGELDHHAMRRLAELSEEFANKRLYTTNRQNIELHGVAADRVAAAAKEMRALGFATAGNYGLRDIVTCVGTTYCPMAVSLTRGMFDRLMEVVRRPKYDTIADRVLINITGCPNSCSPFRIADIGLRGMLMRGETGSVEGYEVLLGGTHDAFGRKLGDFPSDDCPAVVARLLDTFESVRRDGETLADCARRLDGPDDPFAPAVGALAARRAVAPALSEFSVSAGEGGAACDFQTVAKDIPCQAACPAGTNVPAYIEAIARGEPGLAYRINQEANVFPGVLGRICTRPCESRCRHGWTNTQGPVQICQLKRCAADRTPQTPGPLPPWFASTGRRVAVIGGGPAGLTAARELSRYGHDVSVFEKEPQLGGMLTTGIPKFRLPRHVVQAEIDAILAGGVQAHCGESVDSNRLAALATQFDAVLVAAGAMRPTDLELPGVPDGAAMFGIAFMRRYNADQIGDLRGRRAIVIGGGFTAVDCARACARAANLVGDEGSVALMYRRTESQMSAGVDELEAMREERIEIETLVTPIGATTVDGRLHTVVFQRNRLGDATAGGKPSFTPIPESRFERPCDLLIVAIGQSPAPDLLPDGVRMAEGNHTTHPRIFMTGDFRVGSQDVIHAVQDAKSAADAIDAYLMGAVRRKPYVSVELLDTNGKTGRVRDHDLQTPGHAACLPVQQRDGTAEVEQGFDAAQTQLHATRCYLCHNKFEIDQDRCIHCDWCIRVTPRPCIRRVSRLVYDADGMVVAAVDAATAEEGTYIWIDSDQCIRCGKCLRVCPTEAISMRRMRLDCAPPP